MKFNKLYAARVFLVVYYFVGIIGLSLDKTRPLFQELTPFSLIVSGMLLFLFHKSHTWRFWLIAAAVYFLGFAIEVVGVNTGRVFGHYLYGPGLGVGLFGTPVLIGVNWLILSYCAWKIFQGNYRWYLAIPAGAFLVLMYDFALEPVAVSLSWWIWVQGAIPMQNFIAWLIVSFLFILLLHQSKHQEKNPLASWLLLIQLLFLLILNITL